MSYDKLIQEDDLELLQKINKTHLLPQGGIRIYESQTLARITSCGLFKSKVQRVRENNIALQID